MVLSRYTGARVRRKEDPRLITGAATYVDDVRLPGIAHLVVVRSPYAHARINGIDSSRALDMRGVLAVITGEALRAVCGPLSLASEGGSSDGAGTIPKPPVYAMAIDTVCYVGEPVAAVIAVAPDVARDAADAIEVDYSLLPPLVDPEQARQPGAPRLYDEIEDNIGMRWSRTQGDVEEAFACAAVVVKQRIRSQRLAGVPMEGRAVVAAPDPTSGGLTVWTSTQAPHWSRNDIAKALGLGQNQVRVIAPEVGGAFGVKIGAYPEDFIVAAAAVMLKRPVKWIETRTENFQATHHGRDQIADIELAAGRDGKIAALRLNVLQDLGSHPKGTGLPELTGKMATGCYAIPAVEFHSQGVYTTTMAVGAYRGAGRPEAAYYIERAIDLLAGELAMDPAEVRRVNFIPPERFPYVAAPGVEYDSGNYARAL
ncbi:MAG TPA: xanthine dehydrogenase family protein molybdopterin-binding subunit, partial [Nitrolancea sp.]|nr:xanthine dehydrogenase family protein molybdopterin-binding subunit [Nitrolancea sp.]